MAYASPVGVELTSVMARASPVLIFGAMKPLHFALALSTLGVACPALAETPVGPPANASATAPGTTEQDPPKVRYALPFALRPAVAKTLVRSDTSIALQDHGTTVVSMLTAGYALMPDFSLLLRTPYVHSSPDGGVSGGGLGNPLVGALFTPQVATATRLSAFAGVAFPLGMGGGNTGDKATYGAVSSGVYARSAMDNALFAVNYAVLTAGVGLARAFGDLTVHGEVTLLELVRARGDVVEKDANRTNMTTGLFVGYYVVSTLQVGAELRYQRWLSTPAAVDKDPTKRDQATAGLGVRYDIGVGGVMLRPGVMFSAAIDDPMKAAGYKVVTLDLPVVF